MTNEEAKKMLEAKLKCFIAEISGTNHDCNMRLCDGCALNYEQGNMGEQKQALEMAIKALEEQPCEKCEVGNPCLYCEYDFTEKKTKEPCEDCISKQEAINRIEVRRKITCESDPYNYEEWTKGYEEGIDDAIVMINSVPSVTPKQKIGHWSRKTKVDAYDIEGVKTWGIKCQCDRCDFTTIVVEDFGYYNYCPYCGAKMEVKE